MLAERLVDILLDNAPEDSGAEEFFNQHLLQDPSMVFTGPGAWKPFRSEVGDNEVSYGEQIPVPGMDRTRIEVQLWVHPNGFWYFRVTLIQQTPHFPPVRKSEQMMSNDLIAHTPEQKFKLINAIQTFLPQARQAAENMSIRTFETLRQALYKSFYDCFVPLYSQFLRNRS